MHDYYQLKNISYLKNDYGKEQWIQIAGNRIINNSEANFWCCLFSLEHLEKIRSSPEWNSNYHSCFPGFICSSSGNVYQRFTSEEYIEPLLYYREFYGVKKII